MNSRYREMNSRYREIKRISDIGNSFPDIENSFSDIENDHVWQSFHAKLKIMMPPPTVLISALKWLLPEKKIEF